MLPFVLALSASRDLPSPPARFRGYSVHIFRMVLPFETASAEDRRVERERQRRLVFALLRSDPTADCLAAMATNLLDHQFRLEDAVLAAAADEPPPADRLVIFLAAVRAALPEATALFGHAYAAARYGCAAVGSALHVDEDVPGLTPAQMKAIRAASTAEAQARTAQAAQAAQPAATARSNTVRRHSLQLASARATAAAMEVVPAPVAAVVPPPAPPAAAAPARPFDARQVYRCNSCNVLGHWSQDNKCRPVDVQANLARLTALLTPPPPAAAEPVAGSSTGKTEFDHPIFII